MGLDMNLSAVMYLDNFDSTPPETKAAFMKVMPALGLAPFEPVNSIPFITVKICVADWKNAYHYQRT